MRIAKKWFAILLALLLLTTQAAGVLAEEAQEVPSIQDAILNGKEVAYSASFTWDDVMLLDEETRGIVSELLDALAFEGSFMSASATDSYFTSSMKLSGADALKIDTVTTEDGVYINMPLLGSPMYITNEDMEQYLRNLGRYLDSMELEGAEEASYEDAMMAMYQSIESMDMQAIYDTAAVEAPVAVDMEALYEAYDTYGLGDMTRATAEWFENEMKPQEREGEIGSVFDLEASKMTYYELTKAQVVELFELITPMLMENEEYWTFVVQMVNQSMPDGEQVTVEEVMAELPEVGDTIIQFAKDLPDDMLATFNECYDDADEVAFYQIEISVPGDDEVDGAGEFITYMEWLPEGKPFYIECAFEGSGITLQVNGKDELPDDLVDNGFVALLTVMENGEETGNFILQTTSVATMKGDDRVWDGELTFIMNMEGQEMGVEFLATQTDTYKGDDVRKDVTVQASMLMGGMTLPLVTMEAMVETGDSQGAPIDVTGASTAFVEPGKMDDTEFAGYMQNEVMTSAMQGVLTIMSQLPPSVFSAMMGESMGVATEASEAIPAAELEEAMPIEEEAVEEALETEEEATEVEEATKAN